MLLEEIEGVDVGYVAAGGRRGLIVRDGGGFVDEGAVAGESETWLPEMEARGAIGADAGCERRLRGFEHGVVAHEGGDREIDKEEDVSLLGGGGGEGEGWWGQCCCVDVNWMVE